MNPPLYYHMAPFIDGRTVAVLVHVDFRAIATDDLANRSLRAMRSWIRGIEVVLAGQALSSDTPKYVGRPDIVRALQGRSLKEFQWRRKAVD